MVDDALSKSLSLCGSTPRWRPLSSQARLTAAIPEPTWAMHLHPHRRAGTAGINRLLIMLLFADAPGGVVVTDPFPVTMQEMRTMDAAEQRRFMEVAYLRALRTAQRAFQRWPRRKREDANAECVAKVWATWVYNLEKVKDALALLGPNIHFAILWVRYDRKIAGRARGFDVFDYRANMKRQQLDGQGHASPTDRSDPLNGWIDWSVRTDDDPAAWAAALEEAGLTPDDIGE